MKVTTVSLALIAVGCWLAQLHAASQIYHPVVRVNSADGLVYTAVQNATHDRQACGAVNDRFLRPLREGCKQCTVVFARCVRKLHGLEAALHDDVPLAHHRVLATGIRIAIVGSPRSAKTHCEFIANDMVRRGLGSAACVYPAMPPVS